MAENTPGGTNRGGKEFSMEMRLLAAFILMGAVLFLTPYIFKSQAPQKQPAKPENAAAKQATPAKPAAPESTKAGGVVSKPRKAAEAGAKGAPSVSAANEDSFTVDTDLYRVVFSNRGAVVKSWKLKKYKDPNKKEPLELINQAAVQKAGHPFALVFKGQKPATDLNQALFRATPASGGLGYDFEFSDGGVTARKSFRFTQSSYSSHISSEISSGGKGVPHLLAWRGGFGDLTVANAASSQHSLYFDATSGKLETNAAKVAKDGPATVSGNFTFAGLQDSYFAAVFLPEDGSIDLETWSDSVPTPFSAKEEPFVGAAVGGDSMNRFLLFVGPKDIEILRRVNPRLEGLVDFGWFAFLAKPLFLIVEWLTANYVHNYGWSIVAVTILINIALFPLKITSMKSMKKMQGLQPQIQAINAKYKDVGMRDPRKQQQNEEVMTLYKKHGVNPMGGCMPMVLQIPFFIAFYKVLSVATEMRGASWLWVTDLSRPEDIPIRILPLAMIVSQFVMQKMTPSTSPDPSQQRMMMMMPLLFGFMFWGASSGLVLYWLTSNLVGVAQQLFFNRTSTAVEAVESVQVKKKQGRK
jgi:YidC/Oxa1 family membrane protein insertase